MKCFIIIPIFILSGLVLLANSVTDSLKELLTQATGKSRYEILISLMNEGYIAGDSVLYKESGKEAIELSRSMKNKLGEIDAINVLSWAESFYNPELSKKLADEALALSQNEEYSAGTSAASIIIGYYYLSVDLLKANKYLTEALNLAQKNNFYPLMANSFLFLGELSSKYENYTEALSYFFEAMSAFDKFDYDSSNIELYHYGALMNHFGITYKKLKNYEAASNYYEKYLVVSNQLNDSYDAAICYNNLGNLCSRNKDYQKALFYYRAAQTGFEILGAKRLIPDLLMNIGNIYGDLKKIDSAMYYYQLSEKLFSNNEDLVGVAKIKINIAGIYCDNKQYNIAISQFKDAIGLIGSTSELETLRDAYEGISLALEKSGNTALALKYFKNYTKIKDSITQNSKLEEIERLSEKYRIEHQFELQKRADEELAKTTLQNRQRRFNMEYIIMVIFITGIFIALFLFKRKLVRPAIIDGMMFISLILFFEFLMLLKDALTGNWIGDEPAINLAINVALAILLSPVDNLLERILKKREEGESNDETIPVLS